MFKSLCYCLLLSTLGALPPVQAGHGLWEPSRRMPSEGVPSGLHKRWYTIKPQNGGILLWPNRGEISYFFENQDTKEKLFSQLQSALQKWYASGLPEDKFKLTEVSEERFKADRQNVLLIQHNDKGILSSSVGVPPKDNSGSTESSEEESVGAQPNGPRMLLSDKPDVGMLDVEANYAHELGHVWGLIHEHQNPNFWEYPYSTSSLAKSPFRFNCQNLRDWGEVSAKVTDQEEQRAMCLQRNVAQKYQFGASEYLPLSGGRAPDASLPGASVDWESIMLYPSGAGGSGSASPGNDHRADVLLKADGSRILPNLNPSTADVQGLKDLYRIFANKAAPAFINQPASPQFSKFKQLIQKGRCM